MICPKCGKDIPYGGWEHNPPETTCRCSEPPREEWTSKKCLCGSYYIAERYPNGHCNIGQDYERVIEERNYWKLECSKFFDTLEFTRADVNDKRKALEFYKAELADVREKYIALVDKYDKVADRILEGK